MAAKKQISRKSAPQAKKAKAHSRVEAKKPARLATVATPRATAERPAKSAAASGTKMTQQDLREFRDMLVKMRDRLNGQISSLSSDTLRYVDDSSTEDRTDDFDREFALNLVSSEHDALYEINEALRRIEDKTYGRCDECGCAIERSRLIALPFARMCVRCQSAMEKGQTRYRPFGETLAQRAEPVAETAEPEETE